MALGGGTFISQNKVLPGTYINFVSAAAASATLSDRGIATMPLELDWGESGKVIEVTSGDLQKNSQKVFGYSYDSAKMAPLRELFKGAKTLYTYRLNGSGNKADCTYATAKYAGVRGNDLKIVISLNVDDNNKFDVAAYLDSELIDLQEGVASASALVNNDYLEYKTSATLAVTAGTSLTGGTNSAVTGTQHQNYLDAIESYSFNTMGVITTDGTTKALYDAFVKRMRDEIGVKFQLVLHQYTTADYYGVISVENVVTDAGASNAALVPWVVGQVAGCEVNKSLSNKKYSGEYTVNTAYTQAQLSAAITAGKFMFHSVNGEVRVLEDINTLTTTSDTLGDIFKDNQTVRVVDQIGNDIAVVFNTKYLGTVPNDKPGRTALWSDIVKHHQQLEEIRAIEDFDPADVTVEQGDSKKAVVVTDLVTVVNAMTKLYMTVTIQ